VVITLPPSPAVGDTVSVTGESANNWMLAQNAGQTVLTSSVQGNVAPGVAWTPRLNQRVWHWLSSSAAGDVLVAGEAGGNLNTSVDGGVNWTAANAPNGIWISIDMTPSADRIFAVQYGGGMYFSSDRGSSWNQVVSTSPGVNLAGQAYESVNVSADGQRVVAAVQNGPLYVSANGGQSWTVGTIGSPAAPISGWWRAVASSANGMVVIAVDHNGPVYRSVDGGLTWSPLNVTFAGAGVTDRWYRLAMSDDGNVIAMAGNSVGGPAAGNGVYVSHDSGATWTRPFSLVADYSAIAMSPDGKIIGVTISNPNPSPDVPADTVPRASGRVLRSTDGGASFSTLTLPGNDTDWRAIAMSADGNKLAAATGYYGGVPGQLYTSLGNRTSVGTSGSVTGGQSYTIRVQYLGNGQFSVPSSTGGAFTIQ
jgi:hypothetical protein